MTRHDAYFSGHAEGYELKFLTPHGVPPEIIGCYTMGYIDGLEANLNKSPKTEKPEWMTEAQFGSVLKLYMRQEFVLPAFPDFLRKVENYGDYCGLGHQGMFVGIEKDGYTHT